MMRIWWIIIASLISLLLRFTVLAQSSSVTIIELNTKEEYVLIKNEGDTTISLKGWVLHDHDYGKGSVYSYTFADVILEPADVLQMQSGKPDKEHDEDAHKREESTKYLRWSDRNVWNNSCDIAYLLDAQQTLIAEQHAGENIENKTKEHCQ